MLKLHQDKIISNLSVLVEETNLNTLVPELLNRNVFNERMINRILSPSHNSKRQKTDLYLEILKRGPHAFEKLQDALIITNHTRLANILTEMDIQQPSQIHRSLSLNSVGSNRSLNSSDDEDNENDGSCLSTQERQSQGQMGSSKRPENLSSTSNHFRPPPRSQDRPDDNKIKNEMDFPAPSSRYSDYKVSNLPVYETEWLDESIRSIGLISPDDRINYEVERNRPVHVKLSDRWPSQTEGKPRMYKMDSNPRGYALIVNNQNFEDKEEYPDRLGSENDEQRLSELLKQLHYHVELYRNKTKMEMEEIVKGFSEKPELNEVDSIIVTFMSHGQEGESDEDSEIIGVDGIGYKTEDIIGRFYNNSCGALINKPKVFFFQACRGNLTDTGVTVGHMHLNHRTHTDGRKGPVPLRATKIRTHSDIFVAFPVAAGRKANRDYITGAWFIQTIVDVFSKYACTAHLEDLMKLVDEKIKKMNNIYTSNFQTVTTKTIGWNKNMFFNPGLSRDKITKETIFLKNSTVDVDEGMDVVDSASESAKPSYSRLNDHREESDGKNIGCFHMSECNIV